METICVIGIGAMGGGMARTLLASDVTPKVVVGYDRSEQLREDFFREAQAVGRAPASISSSLSEAIVGNADSRMTTKFAILVLVNERQCDAVCFGGDGGGGGDLISLLTPGSCVILCSTVSASWARKAAERFTERNVRFVDCPISGGPVRAKAGELTMMASGNDDSLRMAESILNALGSEVHEISGGAGMGSTVKMVHQLLAGVHIVAAAEALALAAKAGIDVQQMYDIVNGAAGQSFMFRDRAARMIRSTNGNDNRSEEVKSALNIFVKDLDIVHSEAKALQCPIPIASTALQQFVSGQSLGLGQSDDSQVVRVYENITGVPVVGDTTRHRAAGTDDDNNNNNKTEGDEVGDIWKMEDGRCEEIVEVGDEPRHHLMLRNDYVRVLRVSMPPGDTTLAHRHDEDSLYFFLVEGGLDAVNHVKGRSPACDCMEFGEVRYGSHRTDAMPLVHKITNRTDRHMLCIDGEVLRRPPVTSPLPLLAEGHELVKTRDKCRVYRLSLKPGESTQVSYPFFSLVVILKPGTVRKEIGTTIAQDSSSGPPGLSWEETSALGDIDWKEPVMNMRQTNIGDTIYEAYIAEWR